MRESNVVSTSAWKTVTFSFSSFFPLTRIGKRKLWIISWRLQILSLTRYLHCVAVDVRSRWCFVVWPSCLASLHPLGSVALLFLSHENQKCLQGLPTLPWGQKKKSLLVGRHWSKPNQNQTRNQSKPAFRFFTGPIPQPSVTCFPQPRSGYDATCFIHPIEIWWNRGNGAWHVGDTQEAFVD